MASRPLILASGSPQRRAILERLGVAFTVRATDVEELERGRPGRDGARERAAQGARRPASRASARRCSGCDTLVALDGVIYGKPPDESVARATLRALGGRTHEVISGMALLLGDGPGDRRARRRRTYAGHVPRDRRGAARLVCEHRGVARTLGRLRDPGRRGKAGARIDGEVENVVGLPVAALRGVYPELLGA